MLNLSDVIFEKSAFKNDQFTFCDVPEVVFSGKSNVGKSTMINKFINRKSLARVSSTPGKTASINFYRCKNFRIIDLPGYGYAKVAKTEKDQWSALVEGYLNDERKIALFIQLLDIRHDPTEDDFLMLDYFTAMDLPLVIMLTKSDKLNKTELKERTEAFDILLENVKKERIIVFSSKSGEGVEALKSTVETALYRQ